LIKTWRASGLSAPRWTMRACLAGKRYASNVAGYVGFRGKGPQPGPQPSRVNVVFQGGMASAFAKASLFAKGFGGQVGGHVRAVPIFSLL
jgi:hypothetical protein